MRDRLKISCVKSELVAYSYINSNNSMKQWKIQEKVIFIVLKVFYHLFAINGFFYIVEDIGELFRFMSWFRFFAGIACILFFL